ncbi:MAG TPA: phosphate acyltransferase [Gemmatimonadaceae bacterium]
MSFLADVRARAAALHKRIVFPETMDTRTLEAVRALKAQAVVVPLLVLDPTSPDSHAAVRALGIDAIDPSADPRADQIAHLLFAARHDKGMTEVEAGRLARTPLYFADGLVRLGHADGCVAGACHTTAEVLRASLALIGPAAGVRTVSSAFYMVVPPFRGTENDEVLTFTDCAVTPYPTVEQLADIAVAAGRDRRRIVGDDPVIAFLSFSTRGSSGGPSVNLVRNAMQLAHARAPELVIDGEMQADAALIAAVADRKLAGSAVGGRANVLVFPSLDAGNIAYKLVERLADATAVGPIVQGLKRPCSDLSRGATSDDIFHVAAVTALQAHDGAVTAPIHEERKA